MKNNQNHDESLCISPNEARKLLHVSKGRMYEMLRNGEIPYIRNGRRYLIVKALLLENLKLQASKVMAERSVTDGKT